MVIDITNTFSDVESTTLEYTAITQKFDLIAVSTTSTSLIIQFKEKPEWKYQYNSNCF